MAWYNSLATAEKIYFWIAVVGTILLVVQIILMITSFGGGADADADTDFGGDGAFDAPDGDLGISLFTVKGITAFLAIGGWVGLLVLEINADRVALSIVLALISGIASMLLVALAMKGIAKLQCSGNLDKEKLIGREASVYVSIAPSRTGRGKIVLTAQGAYTELDAVTDEQEKIPVDERVVITDVGADYMVVQRVKKD
jgi:membrane protein implicated in regulation of membrane protease activity